MSINQPPRRVDDNGAGRNSLARSRIDSDIRRKVDQWAPEMGMAYDNVESLTILLVDDDDGARRIIREAIAQSKISNVVIEARNGSEALMLLKKSRPGLIYLDIDMPGMGGQETLHQIKSDPDLCDIPVVMMTGVRDESQMKAVAAAGAVGYTLKPANAEQFLRTLIQDTHYGLTIHRSSKQNGSQRGSRKQKPGLRDAKQ